MSDLTENSTTGYDSGVDCCEQAVSDELKEHHKQEMPKITEHVNNGIPVSCFYGSVMDQLVEPNVTDESKTVIHQKMTSQSNKHGKHTRRKKRKHLFTVRRRKSRPGSTPQSCEQTSSAREQIGSEGESFSDFHAIDSSLGTSELLSSSKLVLVNAMPRGDDTQHEIVNITDHLNEDALHVSGECESVNVESDKHIPMHVEEYTNFVAESSHRLLKTTIVNSQEIRGDDCRVSHSSNFIFPDIHVNTAKDRMTCANDYAITEIV